MPVELSPYQEILYTYRVSLYKPKTLVSPGGGDIEATDAGVNITTPPAFVNVPCYYKGTPEVDVATLTGRYKELNIFTLDEWHFPATQPIADQWVIQMTGSDPESDPHPYIGRIWIVRDNPQTAANQGNRRPNYQMIYATLTDLRGLSGLVSGIA